MEECAVRLDRDVNWRLQILHSYSLKPGKQKVVDNFFLDLNRFIGSFHDYMLIN